MATDRAHGGDTLLEVPDLPLGTLVATEVSYKPELDFEEDEINAVRELCRTVQQRDMPARREEVIRVWEKRLFDRGFQHLLPLRNGGWRLPVIGTGYGPGEDNSRSLFETNIYNSYGQIIVSALTRMVPTPRFEPDDPEDDAKITAAEKAERMKDYIKRGNKLLTKMGEMARYLWTDGRAVFFTRYVKDGQHYGYEEPKVEALEKETVPETELEVSEEQEELEPNQLPPEEETEEPEEEEQEREDDEPKEPRGREVIDVEGALEWKFPIKENCVADMSYAQRNKEIDLQIARARYPKFADKIKAWQGGPGGDDIDRLARINTRLGVMDNYITTDSAAYDVTEQITWFRTAALLEVKNADVRDRLIKKAGKVGLRVVFCGETFCEGRALSMDEQLVLVHGLPGDGVHRPGLGDWLVPIQKVLNNWLELADDYFIRGVPNTWMDNEMFNVEKLRQQINMPGATHPFDREPGVLMEQAIWREPTLQFPQYLWEFIQFFTNELPQLLCGAFPALFGGGDSSATDTYGGMLVQRDQALGRVGLPWRQIKEAIACVFQQAIMCRANNSDEPVILREGEEALRIQMQDLKAGFLTFPEVDENFPESWTQIQNRMNLVLQDAASNPLFQQILDSPDNLEVIKNTVGLQMLSIPMLDSRDKQLGENVILLKGGASPNPKLQEIEKQLAQMVERENIAHERGMAPDPQIAQQINQLTVQMQNTPPEISSVEVRPFDDDATELATCVKVLNSPRGRALANGNEDEQAAYHNLELHAQEHKAQMKQKQSDAPPPQQKPVTRSIAIKDLPANEAAQLAGQAGLKATPEDFKQQEVAAAVEKHPGQVRVQ